MAVLIGIGNSLVLLDEGLQCCSKDGQNMKYTSVISVRPSSCPRSSRYSLANTFSTRGKGALGPLLSALAGARKRETPTSNLTESTAHAFNVYHIPAPLA